MFISRRKHEKLLREAVYEAVEETRQEFYQREENAALRREVSELREQVCKLQRLLDMKQGCRCESKCQGDTPVSA